MLPGQGVMRTVLNQRGLLPGQTPVGDFAVPHPRRTPYNRPPVEFYRHGIC